MPRVRDTHWPAHPGGFAATDALATLFAVRGAGRRSSRRRDSMGDRARPGSCLAIRLGQPMAGLAAEALDRVRAPSGCVFARRSPTSLDTSGER